VTFSSRLSRLFYKMPRFFPTLPSSFYMLPKLVPSKMLKFFLRLLKLFQDVLFPRHLRVPRVYPRLLKIFHKLHGFFSMLVAHAFS
jgi:hypothetical protein